MGPTWSPWDHLGPLGSTWDHVQILDELQQVGNSSANPPDVLDGHPLHLPDHQHVDHQVLLHTEVSGNSLYISLSRVFQQTSRRVRQASCSLIGQCNPPSLPQPPGSTRVHLRPPGSTWNHQGPLESTWNHLSPLESTMAGNDGKSETILKHSD